MDRPLKILLVNDDGIHAPGIQALWKALREHAEVTVVAPATEMSGRGAGITMHEPLFLRPYEWAGAEAHALNGTPADCVRIGIHTFGRPDYVFSGINRGSNAGRTILYSGTVGGAIEASYSDIPAVALSSINPYTPDYELAGEQAIALLDYLEQHPLTPGTILNVNVPGREEFQGMRWAEQGRGFWKGKTHERTHPAGHTYFWSWGEPSGCEESELSDVELLRQGYATAVPLRAQNFTCSDSYSSHAERFKSFFSS